MRPSRWFISKRRAGPAVVRAPPRSHSPRIRTAALLVWAIVLGGILVSTLPAARGATDASFSGTALLLLVGKTASGTVVHLAMADQPYQVEIGPASLTFQLMGMTMGGPVATGSIAIRSDSASGGGTLGGDMPSQFGFVASTRGGQFQCLMAGFSAGFSLTMDGMTLTIVQMDVHGTVDPGTYGAG